MARFSLRDSRDYLPGLGTIIWIASIVGVIIGFIVFDLNRKNSLIRRLIEAGRNRVDRPREIKDVTDSEIAEEDAA